MKKVGLLIIFCLIINVLVPRFSIESKDDGIFAKAMKSQSILLQVLTFSSMPIRLVHEMFCEDRNTLHSEHSSKSKQKESKSTSNTSSDFSIVSSAVNISLTRGFSGRFYRGVGGGTGADSQTSSHQAEGQLSGHFVSNLMFSNMHFLAVLACVVLLPRGSIDDKGAILQLNTYMF